MSSLQSNSSGEGLALELFEELLECEPEARKVELKRRLEGHPDASSITARVERLLGVERDMGMVSPGSSLASLVSSMPQATARRRAPQLAPGAVVDGFEILEFLGRGGMGTVYRARQSDPQRDVALKLLDTLPDEANGDQGERLESRLRHEADLLAQLNHPAIASVYLMGVATDAASGARLPWLAMEFIAGGVDVCTALRGRPRREVLATFMQALDGVQHGHQKGIVHCDLKPDNLLVDTRGRLSVIDFGVARLRASEGGGEPIAELGQTGILGTLPYMAPELLQLVEGQTAPDIRCDVYALGVVLFELLFERRARDLEGLSLHETLTQLRDTPLILPKDSGLPRGLRWILAKALDADSGRRYSSVDAFRRDLDAVLRHLPVEAAKHAPAAQRRLYTAGLFVRRNWPALIVLAVLFGSFVFAWRSAKSEAREHARAEEVQAAAFGLSLGLVGDLAEKVALLPGGLETRQEMIETGLATLTELAGEPGSLGPEATLDLATAEVSLGDVLGYARGPNLGRLDAAAGAYDEATALLESLPGDAAAALAPKKLAARLIERRAILLRSRGDLEGALAGLVAWGEALEALLPQAAGVEAGRAAAKITLDMAQSYGQRARIVGFWKRNDEALALFEDAAAVYRGLLAEPPADFDLTPARFNLQQTLTMCAVAHTQLGEPDESLADAEEASRELTTLIEEQPHNAVFLRSRGESAGMQLDMRSLAGDFEGGEGVFESGMASLEALAALDPDDTKLPGSAASLVAIAGEFQASWFESLVDLGDREAAEPHRLRAIEHLEGALERFAALEEAGALSGLGRMQADKARGSLEKLSGELDRGSH